MDDGQSLVFVDEASSAPLALQAQRIVSTPARPSFQTVNPATGRAGRTYEGHTKQEAEAIVDAARWAFEAWRRTSFPERHRLMMKLAFILNSRRAEYASLMTAEMGKCRAQAFAEIEKCVFASQHFANNAERYLLPERVAIDGAKAMVVFQPLGVILAVMPWNFPFWQVLRAAVPALMAGNAVVLKHASSIPGCALALEDLFGEAGFPADVFRTVLVPSTGVRPLIEHPGISAVTLTGSVGAGRSVASIAGGALKRCVLELGGSDPYVVLRDADIELAASVCATARMGNSGQSCNAGKRFIVERSIRPAFEGALVERLRQYRMGDPEDVATKLGPLQSIKARDEIHAQVLESVAGGARLLLGGEVPGMPGAWYPATVLTDVAPGQPAYDAEIFGPVAAIIEARDEADAIRIANDTEFGLGSGVITRDIAKGEKIAVESLEAGNSFVNANVRSDPRMPFGGVKNSGYGRECSAHGMREFVNVKSIQVHSGGGPISLPARAWPLKGNDYRA